MPFLLFSRPISFSLLLWSWIVISVGSNRSFLIEVPMSPFFVQTICFVRQPAFIFLFFPLPLFN